MSWKFRFVWNPSLCGSHPPQELHNIIREGKIHFSVCKYCRSMSSPENTDCCMNPINGLQSWNLYLSWGTNLDMEVMLYPHRLHGMNLKQLILSSFVNFPQPTRSCIWASDFTSMYQVNPWAGLLAEIVKQIVTRITVSGNILPLTLGRVRRSCLTYSSNNNDKDSNKKNKVSISMSQRITGHCI